MKRDTPKKYKMIRKLSVQIKKKQPTTINCKCGHPIAKSTNGHWYHKYGNIMSRDCLVILPESCDCDEPEGEKMKEVRQKVLDVAESIIQKNKKALKKMAKV